MNTGQRLARASTAQAQRDPQQRRAYAAERAIGDGRHFGSLDEIQRYVDALLDSRAVVERFGTCRITVRPGEERRARGGYGRISLPRWSWREKTVLHEVAHCLTDVATHHGPEFCGVLRFLFETQLGNDFARRYADELYERGVEYTKPPAADAARWRRHVERKRERRAAAVEKRAAARSRTEREKTRAPSRDEIATTVATLRRAVKLGVFGDVGSKPRRHALDAARKLEAGTR